MNNINFSNILNELSGSSSSRQSHTATSAGDTVRGIANKIPGGLAGGAVAGGIVAMLVGSKSARKTVGKAAKYGGVAVLGGLAYKAYQNWQQNNSQPVRQQPASGHQHTVDYSAQTPTPPSYLNYEKEALEHMNGATTSNSYQLALIKAMIASARADGNIDGDEQRKISEAIEKMNLDKSAKSELLELFLKPISISDFIGDLESMEQKAEVYLASCLVIDLDNASEYAHLSNLSKSLDLPPGLEHQLRAQAVGALSASA